MHLVLYIQVKPAQEIRFGNPFSKQAHSEHIQFYDADNHSDEWIIQHQTQVIDTADKITLILDVLPEFPLGQLTRLLEKLLRKKNPSLNVFFHGQHQVINNMLRLSKKEALICDSWTQLEFKVLRALETE